VATTQTLTRSVRLIPLFPKGDYFGVLATTGPGPINFIDVHPRIEGTFPKDETASFDWIFQWRESLEDGVYAVPGFLIRLRTEVELGTSAIGLGHKSDGRRIAICGSEQITESSMPDAF
jgi:hypothetical protein